MIALGIGDVTEAKQRDKPLFHRGMKVTRDHGRREGGNC